MISCCASSRAIFLPRGTGFVFCRNHDQEHRSSETQPLSVLRGADCCCWPVWASVAIAAPISCVNIVSSAAKFSLLARGSRILTSGICGASTGVISGSQPPVANACGQRVDRSFCSRMHVHVCVWSVRREWRRTVTHGERAQPWTKRTTLISVFAA